MSIEKRYDIFYQQAIKMHGDKFDYSKAIFVNQKEKIEIICPVHGSFFQCPDKHIAKNAKGCPQCWKDSRKRVPRQKFGRSIKAYTFDDFIKKAKEKFGDKYEYKPDLYIGYNKQKIEIICPEHGSFLSFPDNHLRTGHGCPHCGEIQKRKNNTELYSNVIDQCNLIHKFKYDYPVHNKNSYINKKSIIEIICKEHGIFKKKVQKHLSGQGCFQCKINELIANNILVGGYSEELFEDKPELRNIPAILYYLKINDGEFFKIGITRCSVNNRIKGTKCKAKGEIHSIEILKQIKGTLYECFKAEQRILRENYPIRCFKFWSSELFSRNIVRKIKL